MIRAFTIIAAVAAFAVSAAPVALAGTSKEPPPRGTNVASSEVFELNTVKAPSEQRGIVVTKATDVSSTNRQRGAAGTSKKPPSQGFFLDIGTTETLDLLKARSAKGHRPSKARVGGKMHLEDISLGFNKHYDMSSPY